MPCLIRPNMHHTWLCIMPCLCDGCLPCCLLLSGVASLGSSGFVLELWGFVRLRSFVFFMDSFFFLAGSQARWPLPSISLLSLLASCFVLSLCRVTYHLFTMPLILPCQPLTFSPFLANCCLAMLPLCSAPLIALLVAGEDWSLFLVGTWRSFLVGTLFTCWDITISLI